MGGVESGEGFSWLAGSFALSQDISALLKVDLLMFRILLLSSM